MSAEMRSRKREGKEGKTWMWRFRKQWCHWMTIAGCGKMVTPVESDDTLAPAGEGLHYEFPPFKRVTSHCFCMWSNASQFLWIGSFHWSFFRTLVFCFLPLPAIFCYVLLSSIDTSTPPASRLCAGTCSHVCVRTCKTINTSPRRPHRCWLVAGVGAGLTHAHKW